MLHSFVFLAWIYNTEHILLRCSTLSKPKISVGDYASILLPSWEVVIYGDYLYQKQLFFSASQVFSTIRRVSVTILLFKYFQISSYLHSKFPFMDIWKLSCLCVFGFYQDFFMLKVIHEPYPHSMKDAMGLSDSMP